MSQKLPLGGFRYIEEMSQFNEHCIKSYSEDSDTGYFIEVDVEYPKELHEIHNVLLYLSKRIKIKKFQKLAADLHDKKEYVIR